MTLTFAPLTADRWHDLEKVFTGKGCAFAGNCWCMEYRLGSRRPTAGPGETRADVNRRALRALLEAGQVPGLLAYRDRAPVGWVSLGGERSTPG